MRRAQPHYLVAAALFLSVGGGALILALRFPYLYIWATYEDLYVEWAQFFSFAVAGLIAIRLAMRGGRYRPFFVLLALACLYTVGEEISWGQRLLGFESPHFFEEYNIQQETNLHNFLTGPVHTATKVGVEYALVVGLLLYGWVYPLALRWRWRAAKGVDRLGVPAPPLYLAPFFIGAAPLELGLFHYNEAEVAELLVGLGMALMTVHYTVVGRGPATSVSGRLAARHGGVVVAVVLLAVATTQLTYRSPTLQARIDQRVLNGVEKFARRFESRGRWQQAAEFYRRVYEAEPERTALLQKLTRSYQELGDEEHYRYFYRKSLEVALAARGRQTDTVRGNLSLFWSYRKLGDEEQAEEHAQRARELAAARVDQHPDDADACFWLGRSEEILAHRGEAATQYRRASELDPDSLKYRRAAERAESSASGRPGSGGPETPVAAVPARSR